MRSASLWTAGVLSAAAAIAAALYFWSPQADLSVTVGPPGSPARRFIVAFATVTQANHPRIRVKLIETANLEESSHAIETRAADLGIVRSDAVIPANGEAIAILRRDVVALITPANSSISAVGGLAGRTIGIAQGPAQVYDERTLDEILSYFNLPASSVKRVLLPVAEIGAAIREHRIAAVFAVGPIGPGLAVDAVSAVRHETKGAPKLIAIDEADAINKRFPGLESIDVPAGAFLGRPPVPDDTVTTVALTYRLVAPNTMLDVVAGAIARSIFKTKAQMTAISPVAAQIEAPDPDEKNPVLPIHPGVASYLNNGDQSFLDEFQQLLYLGGILLSVGGSAIALILSRLSRKKSEAEQRRVERLIELADKALSAEAPELKSLETELNSIIAWFVKGKVSDPANSTAFSVAISHAQHAIEKQREGLRSEGRLAPQPAA